MPSCLKLFPPSTFSHESTLYSLGSEEAKERLTAVVLLPQSTPQFRLHVCASAVSFEHWMWLHGLFLTGPHLSVPYHIYVGLKRLVRVHHLGKVLEKNRKACLSKSGPQIGILRRRHGSARRPLCGGWTELEFSALVFLSMFGENEPSV